MIFWISALIAFLCNPFWRIFVGLVMGLLAFGVWRKWKAGAIAGAVAWALLTGIAYLLNLPLGPPPLPALLTPDYTAFWLAVGLAGMAIYLLPWVAALWMLWQIRKALDRIEMS